MRRLAGFTIAAILALSVVSVLSMGRAAEPEPQIEVRPVYYVITEGSELGDSIFRMPVTGNETVLDTLSQIDSLSRLANKKLKKLNVRIERPGPANTGVDQAIPINWKSIMRGDMTTNYRVLPGDRVRVQDDSAERQERWERFWAPLDRILGVTCL